MSANKTYNKDGEEVKFTVEKETNSFYIVTEKGVNFGFSYEVGVHVAVACLIQKTLTAFLNENNSSDYIFEFKVTRKK